MRRWMITLTSATFLIGGATAAASVGAAIDRAETVPSTEPAAATTEAPASSDPPGTTEAPPASDVATTAAVETTGAPAGTDAPATSAEGTAVETTDAAAPTSAGHPLVGSWMLTDASDPESGAFLASFSGDGIYQQADTDGAGFGAWEATGPTSATLTAVLLATEEEGGGTVTIRAAIEVGADGQTLTADYTIELSGEGAPAGEFGPGSVTGTRIVAEPMGTPVGSLDDLFGQFEDTAAPVDTATATAPADTAMVTETTTTP